MATDPNKVAAIKDWPAPTLVKELSIFLGMCGYYQCFIRNYAKIVAPLTALLQYSTVWTWYLAQSDTFEALKAALISSPVL